MEIRCKLVGILSGGKWDRMHDICRRVYSIEAISPTITHMGGGNQEVKIAEPAALRMVRTDEGKRIRKLYESGEIKHGFNEHRKAQPREDGVLNTLSTVEKDNYILEPCISAIRGRNPDDPSDRTPGIATEQRLEINRGGCSNTLTTVQKDNMVVEPGIRVRRLTPKECWRLMGFSDEDYEKAEKVVSKSQLYRQAGNSIVVNVLMAIFKEMLPK